MGQNSYENPLASQLLRLPYNWTDTQHAQRENTSIRRYPKGAEEGQQRDWRSHPANADKIQLNYRREGLVDPT